MGEKTENRTGRIPGRAALFVFCSRCVRPRGYDPAALSLRWVCSLSSSSVEPPQTAGQ